MINSQLRTLGMTLIWSQLFLALSWAAYLDYLPRLVRDAGLSVQAVPWLLAMDQAIFVLTDCAIGARVGKMAKTIGRIGPPTYSHSPGCRPWPSSRFPGLRRCWARTQQ
jgi:hypothetical protein